MDTVSLKIPALAGLLFLPLLAACTEGGCDEPPAKTSQASPGVSGASSSKSDGGSVGIPAGAGEPRKAKPAAKAPEDKPRPPALAEVAASPLESVDASSFKPKVLKRPEALVSLYFPGCTDCDLVVPVLETVARDFKGKLDVYRLDSSVPENLALLPKGFTAKAYPSFLLYREGAVVSWKQGMPFESRPASEAAPAETAAEYQGRLSKWFNDALSRGTLVVAP
ncbi:MAG: hypothetical protein HZB91_13300 [Elusimicrobia bacterium]|nr:hypothetical protein [Elusimicrobiota bacterium]